MMKSHTINNPRRLQSCVMITVLEERYNLHYILECTSCILQTKLLAWLLCLTILKKIIIVSSSMETAKYYCLYTLYIAHKKTKFKKCSTCFQKYWPIFLNKIVIFCRNVIIKAMVIWHTNVLIAWFQRIMQFYKWHNSNGTNARMFILNVTLCNICY